MCYRKNRFFMFNRLSNSYFNQYLSVYNANFVLFGFEIQWWLWFSFDWKWAEIDWNRNVFIKFTISSSQVSTNAIRILFSINMCPFSIRVFPLFLLYHNDDNATISIVNGLIFDEIGMFSRKIGFFVMSLLALPYMLLFQEVNDSFQYKFFCDKICIRMMIMCQFLLKTNKYPMTRITDFV